MSAPGFPPAAWLASGAGTAPPRSVRRGGRGGTPGCAAGARVRSAGLRLRPGASVVADLPSRPGHGAGVVAVFAGGGGRVCCVRRPSIAGAGPGHGGTAPAGGLA